jgi:CHAD domain-containing protein
MVKELEHLELPKLRNAFHAGKRVSRVWNRVGGPVAIRTPAWVEPIWAQITARKTDAVAAIERAPAIYLPNRIHAARVAVKKLRYAVEVASDTGVWTPRRVLRDLRKTQGILGNVHDLQVLVDLVDQSRPAEEKPSDSAIVVKNLLTTEIERYHAEYARRRSWIFGIADACERAATRTRWHVSTPIVAVSLFTAPLLLESIRSERRV